MAKSQKVTQFRANRDARRFDPTDPILRQTHPMYLGQYLLPTPSITNMAQRVALWLRKGVTGGSITGESNYGKTKSIKYIRRIRRDLLGPGVAVAKIPMARLPERNNIFWQHVAGQLGFTVMKTRPAELNMLDKSIAGLLRICEADDADKLVIFIDDAQFMLFEHYVDLKPIYDALTDEHEKRVLVVSVGENSLKARIEDIKRNGKTAVNRFLRTSSPFAGVSGAQQLEIVLGAYDSVLQFPPGSNVSYTESLIPRAYNGGFRLGSLASRVFEQYKDMVKNKSDYDSQVLTMKTCTVFAQSILDDLAGGDSDELVVTDDMIDASLQDAIGLWSVH